MCGPNHISFHASTVVILDGNWEFGCTLTVYIPIYFYMNKIWWESGRADIFLSLSFVTCHWRKTSFN